MDPTAAPPLPPPPVEAPDADAVMPMDVASRQLSAAMAGLQQVERLTCEVVLQLASILDTGVCETVEGLRLDHFLRVQARLIGSDAATLLTTALPDVLPTVSATLLELIAHDARIQAVLFDGARPLATCRKLHAQDVPADVRTAIRARDRAERFPGSLLPASRGHRHHLRQRAHGGTHHPDDLLLLADTTHDRLVHRRGRHTTLDPDTAVPTVRRDDRSYRSLPRGTPLEPEPGAPP